MQTQELQSQQNNPPAVVEFNYTPVQEYSLILPPISTGNISQTQEKHVMQEYALVSLGVLFATGLAKILDMLRTRNQQAVYHILSILEPYMEPVPELNFSFPPKSSREVIIEVTRKGRVEPIIYLDDSL